MNESKRVLVVDDNETVRTTLGNATRRHCPFASVTLARDGDEALRQLHDNGRFDAVLLDLNMPGISGWTVLSDIANDVGMSYMPVIIISGAAIPPAEKSQISHRSTAYMDKETFSLSAFEALLDDVLGKSDPDLAPGVPSPMTSGTSPARQ